MDAALPVARLVAWSSLFTTCIRWCLQALRTRRRVRTPHKVGAFLSSLENKIGELYVQRATCMVSIACWNVNVVQCTLHGCFLSALTC